MSPRESGSDTWPRFAAFPRDTLDLGDVPEEDNVDHRTEPPSWRSEAGPVAAGADPPDPGQEGEETHDNGQAYAVEGDQPPGFGGAPPLPAQTIPGQFGEYSSPAPGFGDEAHASPGFGHDQHDAPGFQDGQPDPSGFGGFPAPGSPGFDASPPAPGASGFGEAPAPEPYGGSSFGPAPSFGGSGEPGPGFADYSPPGTGYGDSQVAGPYGNGPAAGPMYGHDAAPGGYPQAQENGAPPGAAYPAQYRPTPRSPSAKSKMTASLKAVKRPKPAKRSRPGRQAQLTVARFEPWSVMKFSFVMSLVAFIVLFVAVAVLYAVLSALGVFDALQHTISSITSSQSSSGFNVMSYLSASRVLGYTGLLGAINVVLITALATVGSVLYNIAADLAGGIEVTLKETD